MLYHLTEAQSHSHRSNKPVEIPDGYSVIGEGDIVVPGTLLYFGDTNKVKPWYEMAKNNFGKPIRNNIGIYIAPLPKMDKWENLVIRICKGRGNKPYKLSMIRRALARRCALKVEWVEECFIFSFLFDLAKRYKEIDFARLVTESAPKEVWKVGMKETDSHFLRFAANLVAEIQRIPGKDLVGYTPHAGFRNSQKTS